MIVVSTKNCGEAPAAVDDWRQPRNYCEKIKNKLLCYGTRIYFRLLIDM